MARQKNPITVVLAYFSDAPLEVAEQGLALAKAVVARRQGLEKPAKKKAKPTHPYHPQAGSAAVPSEQPHQRPDVQAATAAARDAVKAGPAQTAKPPRTRTTVPLRKGPEDVALPGMPGPVAQVGD